MTDATFTFRVEEDLKHAFASAARSKDRSGAQLLRDFMRDFVHEQREAAEHDAWFKAQVRAGLKAADAGDVVSAEEVEAEALAWRKRTLAAMNRRSDLVGEIFMDEQCTHGSRDHPNLYRA